MNIYYPKEPRIGSQERVGLTIYLFWYIDTIKNLKLLKALKMYHNKKMSEKKVLTIYKQTDLWIRTN